MKEESSLFDIRGEKNKKINLGKKKENFLCSLSEVEHFLCHCNKAIKCGKIVKIFSQF